MDHDNAPKGGKSPSQAIAREMARAHGKLRAAFDQVEAALGGDDLADAKARMAGLLDLVREHFFAEEALAMRAGLSTDAAGRVLHDAFVERAYLLLERIGSAKDEDARTDVESRLVMLLSDVVENDLRLQRRVRRGAGAPANSNIASDDA